MKAPRPAPVSPPAPGSGRAGGRAARLTWPLVWAQRKAPRDLQPPLPSPPIEARQVKPKRQPNKEAPTRPVAQLRGLALGLLPGALALRARLGAALLRRASHLRRGGGRGRARRLGGLGRLARGSLDRHWRQAMFPAQAAFSKQGVGLSGRVNTLPHLRRLVLGCLPGLGCPLGGGAGGLADPLRKGEEAGERGRVEAEAIWRQVTGRTRARRCSAAAGAATAGQPRQARRRCRGCGTSARGGFEAGQARRRGSPR